MIILGGTSRNMIFPLIKMDFRFSAVLMQPFREPARHIDRPNSIGGAVAQE